MSRISAAGLAFGFGLLGGTSGAIAQVYHRPCSNCGPVGTTRIYRTVHPLQYVTRYHDRSVFNHVTRVHYVENVTRIQPIIHVNDVTRIHHHTIVAVRDVYAYPTEYAAPVTYVQPSPMNLYNWNAGCSCGE